MSTQFCGTVHHCNQAKRHVINFCEIHKVARFYSENDPLTHHPNIYTISFPLALYGSRGYTFYNSKMRIMSN